MKRKKFYKKVYKLIAKEKKLSKETMGSRRECFKEDYKVGIYFLYNKDNKIIYVGKVGNGKGTSLYHRIKGNSNAAHCKKSWYAKVEYGKFHRFENLNNSQLEIVERICIQFNKNVDNYNDKVFDQNDLDGISKLV